MAPRKKNPAIKSSGSTSSKASPLPDWVKGGGIKPTRSYTNASAPTASGQPCQLFPPGSKTPLNILYERVQKLPGWEKPIIEPRRQAAGYSCVVTLRKVNKQDASNPFTVRFEPKEPGLRLECPTSLEAKHWGATYALFRLFSNLPLHRALPPGPREYWQQLEGVKKDAAKHMEWMWESDPFEAQLKREKEREEKEKAKQAAASGQMVDGMLGGRTLSKAWQQAKEVRMSSTLRKRVEATIRRMMTVFPEACTAPLNLDDSEGVSKPVINTAALEKELISLGFRPGHARSAVSWLVQARQSPNSSDPLVASASTLPDREAAIEYLMLYTPEDDLPTSFKPSKASEAFVTGAGGDDLATGWAIERITKAGGYPREATERVFKTIGTAERQDKEGLALEMINRKMAGWDAQWGPQATFKFANETFGTLSDEDKQEITRKREDENLAVEAVLGPKRIVQTDKEGEYDVMISKGKEDLRIRVKSYPRSAYPSPQGAVMAIPCFFVVSETLPSYLKLALTLHLLKGCKQPDWEEMLVAGEGGVLLAMVEELESVWKEIVDHPPLLGDVMKHLVPKKLDPTPISTPETSRPITPSARKQPRSNRPALKRLPKVDAKLQSQQQSLHSCAAYAKLRAIRRSLPAYASTSSVLDLISSNRVVIVAGETGCGKTTQVPQFILDEAISSGRGSECNIVVTQPRRVGAMGVAARVAVERGEELGKSVSPGSLVGYAIRGERRASKECRLLFTTTGVLLRRLGAGGDRDLSSISHVIVDEVHERSVDSDFLLLELKEVLKRNKKIKVVLMSATINQETFSGYFGGAPCLEIPGRTFPVKDWYLEDIVRESRFRPSEGRYEGKQSEEQKAAIRSRLVEQGLDEQAVQAVESLSRSERINYDLVGSTAKWVIERAESQEASGEVEKGVGGAILIFLPGVGEIRQAMEAIRSSVRGTVDILPLHTNLSPDEQRRVFLPSKHRKIVISTNVAETCITIPDISYVIDTGRVKETRFEPESSLTRLVECWTSRAACRQRRGRAGRVRQGECFKLYTRYTEDKMTAQQTPEMRRVPLERLFLEVKSMREEENVKEYLNKAIDPPATLAMDTALRTLIEVGALQQDGGYSSHLTPLGRHLAQLPLDLRLGKLLILGVVFNCLSAMLTVASIMSCKPLFAAPLEKRDEAAKARSAFAARSDLLADMKAYDAWLRLGSDRRAQGDFCEKNFLSPSTLRDISTTRMDLLSHLQEMGFVPDWYSAFKEGQGMDGNSKHSGMLRALVGAGLWPSVIRIALPPAKFDQTSSGAVQRDAEAKSVKYYDQSQGRVFLFPSSTLFHANNYDSSYLAVFQKSGNGNKIYMRDATEVPLYGLLLFGGRLSINHFAGGVAVGWVMEGEKEAWVKLRANARIGVLCAQLRRLLDAVLKEAIENPGEALQKMESREVVQTMVALLDRDGM